MQLTSFVHNRHCSCNAYRIVGRLFYCTQSSRFQVLWTLYQVNMIIVLFAVLAASEILILVECGIVRVYIYSIVSFLYHQQLIGIQINGIINQYFYDNNNISNKLWISIQILADDYGFLILPIDNNNNINNNNGLFFRSK